MGAKNFPGGGKNLAPMGSPCQDTCNLSRFHSVCPDLGNNDSSGSNSRQDPIRATWKAALSQRGHRKGRLQDLFRRFKKEQADQKMTGFLGRPGLPLRRGAKKTICQTPLNLYLGGRIAKLLQSRHRNCFEALCDCKQTLQTLSKTWRNINWNTSGSTATSPSPTSAAKP